MKLVKNLAIIALSLLAMPIAHAMDPNNNNNEKKVIINAPIKICTLHQSIKESLEQNKNIDINKNWGISGRTPLISAAAYGDLECIKFFLEKGANINLQDYSGNTPLSTALYNRKCAAALYLLEQNASPYILDINNKSSLHELIAEHHLPEKNNFNWPKDLLRKLLGECPICLEEIEEVEHIYECGHVVHRACAIAKCPYCQN